MSEPIRTALVTGASRGIGRGIALSLARQGFGLTITSRTRADLEALASDLEAAGAAQVVLHAADMADRDALPEVVALHAATYDATMSALVLNAGVGTAGAVADFPRRRLDKTLNVNLVSAFVLVQEALPLLRAGAAQDRVRGSSIVGVSSITGLYAEAGLAVYGASKAALISLLATVTLEEGDHGITATTLAPGYVETEMSAWATDRIPADSMIRVDDVVAVVDLLVNLGRNARIPTIVMTRRDSSGYEA
jgi:NAD(P)-dependent dehydrogenase (short-subunit alcohol dehydrogenase family)